MTYQELDSSACSIARTASLIADPWTAVVLRDIANGVRRFDDLVEHLGIARNVLTRRLGHLVEAGIIERHSYREPGQRARFEYRMLPAGWDLQVVLLAMVAFGDKHLAGPEGPPAVVEHVGCGSAVGTRLVCAGGHVLGSADRMRVTPGPGARYR